MSWELALAVLPWLALLACPLMMLWMMRGMGGGKACLKPRAELEGGSADGHSRYPSSQADEIAALRAWLARLEAEQREAAGAREPSARSELVGGEGRTEWS